MPLVTPTHADVLDAIKRCKIFSELVQEENGKFIHEADVETIVYGRQYTGGKQVGPYVELLEYDPGTVIITEGQSGRNTFYLLLEGSLDVSFSEADKENRKIVPDKPIFGEMSLFSGQPSSATVKVVEKAKVLEIKRPALTRLRKFPTFSSHLDESYRTHSFDQMLQELKKTPSPELKQQLEAAAQFELHGKGHVLFEEGDRIEHIILIRRGWVQRACSIKNPRLARTSASDPILASKLEDDKNLALDFLGDGNWLGLDAVDSKDSCTWSYTATVMARTEVLEIAISDLKENSELVNIIKTEFPHSSNVDDDPPKRPQEIKTMQALAVEIDSGIIDGTNLLVMDMDKCVRCGNCSLACHRVHGQSRLVRHGIHIERPKPKGRSQHLLAPSVCLHCHDAECLTGCPTGAIKRLSNMRIDIELATCIGCGDCATQCPYDAISLVPKKPPAPGIVSTLKRWISPAPKAQFPEIKDTRDLLAVKCNLCQDTPLNPEKEKRPAYSCEENCPTGALIRVDPQEYFSEAKNAIGIRFLDKTHAFGRNIHHQDPLAKRFHIVGVVLTIAITAAMLAAVAWYKLDGHLNGTWLTMRWVTGLLGLASIVIALTYSGRRQIYRHRAGALRYWMLVHVYIGVIAGIVLLIHGGRDTRGLLTSLLMISFDLTIVTGLFGIACYYMVPRLMTRIEEEPLLIEDLQARRAELREKLKSIKTDDKQLEQLVKKKMRKHFFSFRYLLREYLGHEKLKDRLEKAHQEFQEDCSMLDLPLRNSLKEAVETTATLRRVDSLIYLHQLLKVWLAPHVIVASFMVALMMVHIVQVLLFTVR